MPRTVTIISKLLTGVEPVWNYRSIEITPLSLHTVCLPRVDVNTQAKSFLMYTADSWQILKLELNSFFKRVNPLTCLRARINPLLNQTSVKHNHNVG